MSEQITVVVNGKELTTEAAPRMTVFVYQAGVRVFLKPWRSRAGQLLNAWLR